MGARETALNVLIACRKDGAWSNGVLKEYLVRDRLDSRDAALATRMCYGVLQNRLKLDHYLKQLLTGNMKNLHPAVRDILHLGLYQILEMDRIPDSAAVNESVALTKKYCKKQRSAPGLVNAVLRSAVRDRDTLLPPKGWQEIYSYPQPLIDLLIGYVGKPRMEAMLKANNEAPKTVVQVNTLKTTAASLMTELERPVSRPNPMIGWKTAWCCPAPATWKSCLLSGTACFMSRTQRRSSAFFAPRFRKTALFWIAARPPAVKALPRRLA